MASSCGDAGALSRRFSETPRKRHRSASRLPRTGGTVTEAVKRAAAGRRSVTQPSIRPGRRRESVTEKEIPRRRGCITSPKRTSPPSGWLQPSPKRRPRCRRGSKASPKCKSPPEDRSKASPKRKCPPAAGPQPSPKRGSRLHGGKKRHQYADVVHGEDEKRHRKEGPNPAGRPGMAVGAQQVRPPPMHVERTRRRELAASRWHILSLP